MTEPVNSSGCALTKEGSQLEADWGSELCRP
jgi:hypothetical protein